jgi:hypothetical protein
MKFVAASIAVFVSKFRRFSKSPGALSGRMVRQKNTRFLHLLLHARVRRQSAGFSLILVFLMVLTVLTTTLSINSRLIAGQYAESLQGKLRMARNAAENGLILASSELNKPGNRRLLGDENWNNWLNRWNNQNYFSMHEYWGMHGDCKIYDQNTYRVTEQAAKLASSSALQIQTGDNQGSAIIGFALYDKDHKPVSKASRSEISYLALVAQGYYNSSTAYLPGQTWKVDVGSTAYNASAYKTTKFVLQQEFNVIPRCCGRSFGGDFGTDPIKPDSNGNCPDGRFVEWYLRGVNRASAHNATT